MNEQREQIMNISDILNSLKKRWIMIVAITLGATLISGILSFFVIDPVYETSTKLFIGKDESNTEAYNNNDIAMYQKLLKTYAEAIKTKGLVEKSLAGLNYDLEAKNVISNLSVVAIADTQILQIKYKSKNQEEARETLKSITEQFIVTSKELVPNGNVKILEEVELPENPISPNKKINIAIAFVLGFMVSIGIAILLEYLDNTYKNKDQLEKELGIPVLGIIPDIDII